MVREKKRFENVLDDAVAAGMNAGTEVLMNQVSSQYLLGVLDMKLTIYTLGGAHYTDADESTRVLPSRRRTFRLGLYERLHRSYRLSRYALQAAQGQHEQRGFGSVLSRGWNSPFSVSIAFMEFCFVYR